jgi:Spy/CpxP family protein refolding chaperone
MRRVQGMLLVLVAAFVLSGGLLGQEKVKGVLPPNWGKLGLTDEQKQKVYKIEADYKGKIADLQKQIDELKGKEKEDMLKVLTDEQKKRLKDILAEKAGGGSKEEKKEEKKDK